MVSGYSIMQLGSGIFILTACDGLFHEKTDDIPGCGLSTRTLGSPLVVIAEGVSVPLFNNRKKKASVQKFIIKLVV
jgi:hypothetical protein